MISMLPIMGGIREAISAATLFPMGFRDLRAKKIHTHSTAASIMINDANAFLILTP